MNMRNVLPIVYFVLTIYSFSGGLVHGVANYSSWKLISAEDLFISTSTGGFSRFTFLSFS